MMREMTVYNNHDESEISVWSMGRTRELTVTGTLGCLCGELTEPPQARPLHRTVIGGVSECPLSCRGRRLQGSDVNW